MSPRAAISSIVLKGHYRVRTGDWRVLFTVNADVIVVRIEHRSKVYDD